MVPDMPDQQDRPHDPAWYQDRWQELMDLLPASSPDEVIERVRAFYVEQLESNDEALDERGLDPEEARAGLGALFDRLRSLRRQTQVLRTLEDRLDVDGPDQLVDAVESLRERAAAAAERQSVLREAGFDRPEVALQAIESMQQQLDELYTEKTATERTDAQGALRTDGDTFDQLQALLAREEKLQRELGVSNPDEVVEMVEGLTDQLEELYDDRDTETSTDSIFAPEPAESEPPLEAELGVSDPEAVAVMMEDLIDQLDVLYEGRSRLAEMDLEGPDDAVAMLKNMQRQLETLYESQEALSAHGVDNIDHARSVIENMEAQLTELYEARADEADGRGTEPPSDDGPLLSEDTRQRLPEMDPEALNALPVGLFRVDDRGVVRWASDRALRWPDVTADSPDALVGTHFFEDVAPAAASAPFRGRFAEGVEAGRMDERFVYTYVGAQASATNLRVHLYSVPDQSAHWIVFQVLEPA
jgi:photoactive yellow protein